MRFILHLLRNIARQGKAWESKCPKRKVRLGEHFALLYEGYTNRCLEVGVVGRTPCASRPQHTGNWAREGHRGMCFETLNDVPSCLVHSETAKIRLSLSINLLMFPII